MVKLYTICFGLLSLMFIFFTMNMAPVQYFCMNLEYAKNSRRDNVSTTMRNIPSFKGVKSNSMATYGDTDKHRRTEKEETVKTQGNKEVEKEKGEDEKFDVTKLEWMDMKEGHAYNDYGEDNCRKLQRKDEGSFRQIFRDWVILAKKHNIKYYLIDGTLLGAWRNGDIIPGDSDLDIVVDINELPKLEKLQYNKPFSHKDSSRSYLRVQIDWKLPMSERRRTDCANKIVPGHLHSCTFAISYGRMISGGVHMDIFGSITTFDTVRIVEEKSQAWHKHDIYPLKRCMFFGVETLCPQNTRKVLNHLYKGVLTPLTVCRKGKWVNIFKTRSGYERHRANRN